MAEAFLNELAADRFEAESAGLEPGNLNAVVVRAMEEEGIDISQNKTKSVMDMLGKEYDYVFTVCDEAQAEKCPAFPGGTEKIHWGFPDPSGLEGSDEEKLEQTRVIRDQIKHRIERWVKEQLTC